MLSKCELPACDLCLYLRAAGKPTRFFCARNRQAVRLDDACEQYVGVRIVIAETPRYRRALEALRY